MIARHALLGLFFAISSTLWTTAYAHIPATCESRLGFRPNPELAQTRPIDVQAPKVDDLMFRMMTPMTDQIKWLERDLESTNAVASKNAIDNLTWLMRFHEDAKIRMRALFAFRFHPKAVRWAVGQMIAAELHETDYQVKLMLHELIEATLPDMEAHLRRERTPLKFAGPDIAPSLNPQQRTLLMDWLESAFTVRAPLEARARMEQIPEETVWLEKLRELSSLSDEDLKVYQKALSTIVERRTRLSDLLFHDYLLHMYFHGMVEIVELGETSTALNREKFPTYSPPFTPDKPYVRIRIKDGQEIELCRTYGGEHAKVGGSFFFPCRDTYPKTRAEARDTGALPEKNPALLWRAVKFGAGEEFYLGGINPQYSPIGEPIPDFGFGGLGGEIQLWRPPGRPYFTEEQMSPEVTRIEDYRLQRMAAEANYSAFAYGDHDWHAALKIYREVEAENNANPNPQRTADLKSALNELQRIHRSKYVNLLNRYLKDLGSTPAYDADYMRNMDSKLIQNLRERDRIFHPVRTHTWMAFYDWSEKISEEFTEKYKKFFETGERPVPIIEPKFEVKK